LPPAGENVVPQINPTNLVLKQLNSERGTGYDLQITWTAPKDANEIKHYIVRAKDVFGKTTFEGTSSKTIYTHRAAWVGVYNVTVQAVTTKNTVSQALSGSTVLKLTEHNAKNFADVSKLSKQRKASVTWLSKTRITIGVKENSKLVYNPSDRVTRGQMAEFIYKVVGSPYHLPIVGYFEKDATVTRLKKIGKVGIPRHESIEWIADKGITIGCSVQNGKKVQKDPVFGNEVNKAFCADDYVTRGQMASFLYKVAGEPKLGKFADPFKKDKAVQSLKKSSAERYKAILWMKKMGITVSVDGNKGLYDPNAVVNRGSMAQFMHRLHQVLITGKKATV
jgi:hypothetical protein